MMRAARQSANRIQPLCRAGRSADPAPSDGRGLAGDAAIVSIGGSLHGLRGCVGWLRITTNGIRPDRQRVPRLKGVVEKVKQNLEIIVQVDYAACVRSYDQYCAAAKALDVV